METHAHFSVRFPHQTEPCAASVIVRCNPDNPTPLRRFRINDRVVDYSARKNPAGQFKAFLKNDEGEERELPDFVDTLIGNFVAACEGREELLVTGADGAQNVEWQLRILQNSNAGPA
jgi:hypothetical protein